MAPFARWCALHRRPWQKDALVDELYDAFISLLAGIHGIVDINTRLRADTALQAAFGIFHVSGFLVCDALGHILQIVLNQAAPLAPPLVASLRDLLAPAHVAVILGQT